MSDDFWAEQARIERDNDLSLAVYFLRQAQALGRKRTVLAVDFPTHIERLKWLRLTARKICAKWGTTTEQLEKDAA